MEDKQGSRDKSVILFLIFVSKPRFKFNKVIHILKQTHVSLYLPTSPPADVTIKVVCS